MARLSYTIIEIYVATHCLMSDYTYEVIDTIHREFPHVEVQVINIDQAVEVPSNVFATPTYLVDGRLWSLGNPSLEQVRALLA